ncbi:MAG TPA: TfoX/Sxy family protein [Caulobacteraceae bacterium]|jgi:TfoX/Sxy family transcriptional regulator of competence genes
MAWEKAPQGLIDLFDESLPNDPRLARRKMFGYPAVFVGGNLAAGIFRDRIFARLSAEDRAALPGGGGYLEPLPGRPMKAYAVLPDDTLADEEAVAQVLAQAVALTAALPVKEKKQKRKPLPMGEVWGSTYP